MMCDELRPRERLARFVQGGSVHRQTHPQGGIRVVTQTLIVSNGDQKEIERQGIGLTALNIVIPYQLLVDPAELLRHSTADVPCGNRANLLKYKENLENCCGYMYLLNFI
jgi:hypothetical protein